MKQEGGGRFCPFLNKMIILPQAGCAQGQIMSKKASLEHLNKMMRTVIFLPKSFYIYIALRKTSLAQKDRCRE